MDTVTQIKRPTNWATPGNIKLRKAKKIREVVKSVVKHIFDYLFYCPNRQKSAWLKAFRRLSLSGGANTVYAPKAGAIHLGGGFRGILYIGLGKNARGICKKSGF